MSVAGNAVRNL